MTDPVSHRCHDLFSFPKKKKPRFLIHVGLIYNIYRKKGGKKNFFTPTFSVSREEEKIPFTRFYLFFPALRCRADEFMGKKEGGHIIHIYIDPCEYENFFFFKENLTEPSALTVLFFPRDLWPLLSYSHI